LPDSNFKFLRRKAPRNHQLHTKNLLQSTIDPKIQIDCKLNYKEGEAWMLAWEKESSTSREEAELVKQQVRESGSLQGIVA
jgi:hypothetical protein